MRKKILTSLLVGATLSGVTIPTVFAENNLSLFNCKINNIDLNEKKMISYNSVDNCYKKSYPLQVKERDGSTFKQNFTKKGFQHFYYPDSQGYRLDGYGYVYEWNDNSFSVATGLYKVNDKLYLADERGNNLTGVNKYGDDVYYLNGDVTNAYAQKGWKWSLSDRAWYYFGEDYKAVKGEQTINGRKYLFYENRQQHRGLFKNKNNGKIYYYGGVDGKGGSTPEQACLTTGYCYIGNDRYFFNPKNDGAAQTMGYDDGIGYMYFNKDGVMQKGVYDGGSGTYLALENKRNGNFYQEYGWYTDKSNGNKRYYFDKSLGGKAVTGWYNHPNGNLFFKDDGSMARGINQIGDGYYLFKSEGRDENAYQRYGFYTDQATRSKDRYYFDKTLGGKAVTGWYYGDRGGNLHFNNEGIMSRGVTKIGSDYYLFVDSGAGTNAYQKYGWYTDKSNGNKRYYFNKNAGGKAVKGENYIDGKLYYFDSEGVLQK